MVTDPADWLKVAIDSYHKSLSEAHLRIGIKAYELLKGIPIIFSIHFQVLPNYKRKIKTRRRNRSKINSSFHINEILNSSDGYDFSKH